MADTKISALPASTTPLAGTEVLPIVQGGATKQVSVANLTAGRAISATSVTATTGNLVIGTSGQGIDFSATPGTGTSELLADYEEGTWTPTWSGGSLTLANNRYTKFGRTVFLTADITFGASVDATAGALTLPFTPLGWGAGSINFTDISATVSVNVDASGSLFFRSAINGGNSASVTLATKRFIFTAQYIT